MVKLKSKYETKPNGYIWESTIHVSTGIILEEGFVTIAQNAFLDALARISKLCADSYKRQANTNTTRCYTRSAIRLLPLGPANTPYRLCEGKRLHPLLTWVAQPEPYCTSCGQWAHRRLSRSHTNRTPPNCLTLQKSRVPQPYGLGRHADSETMPGCGVFATVVVRAKGSAWYARAEGNSVRFNTAHFAATR